MPSPLVVPFNNDPVSVSVRTASYTIPAGRYANVVANLEGSATLTINGTTALRGTQNSVLASDNLSINPTQTGSNFITYTELITSGFKVGVGGSNYTGSAFNETTDQKTVVQDFWVPTGTVINGSGTWRAIVVEYNKIS